MASQKLCHGRMELLWKHYFRDPLSWYDNRTTKSSSISPDFRHKTSCSESLWVHGCFNPCWVSEELTRRAEKATPGEIKIRYEKREEEEEIRAGIQKEECLESTYVSLLISCTKRKDVGEGAKVHGHIRRMGLLDKRSPYVGSALISMYAKCGKLQEARQVLEELAFRCVVSWNSLISGYAQHRQSREAIDCFDQMQNEGVSPDAITFTCILKACGMGKNIIKGKLIHEAIVDGGLLKKDVVLGTALVDMYIKCGDLAKGEEVLRELPVRDQVTWNAVITGYAQEGQGHEAFNCFECMRKEGFSMDSVTFLSVLKACSVSKDVSRGVLLHDEIVEKGWLVKDLAVGNALVDMYAKCGALTKAHQVLEELPIRNVISWNSLVAGYAQEGQDHNALNCFEQMRNEGVSPDPVTFICILNACAKTRAIEKGKQVHEEVASLGLLEKSCVLSNALIDMYAKCGVLEKAQAVLEKLPNRDVVAWSAIIAGYAEQGQGHEALECLERMQSDGLSPNAVTLISILKACGSIGAVKKGKDIHDEIMKRGLLPKNAVLGTAVVDMYAKCGLLAKAREVLEELPMKNTVSWSALLGGCGQQGKGNLALECFEHMQNQGLSPDEVTFVCILKACGSTHSLDKGKQVHDEIASKRLLETNGTLGNALVDMYCKCGALARAQEVFKELPSRDVISWNTLIAGYTQRGQYREALDLLKQMRNEGFHPDAVSFICILQACGSIGAIDEGKQIHDEVLGKGLLEKDAMLGNALVDMYAKCGLLARAQEVLLELPIQDLVAWNALIAGYAEQRQGKEALKCFNQMQSAGLSPNDVTLLCVLNACCHSGLLEESQSIFRDMTSKYGVTPKVEHHTCMIMAFGYAGLFENALSTIKGMPSSDDPVIWLALLGACRKWGNVELGKLAFDQAIQLDGTCSAAYVIMINLFTLAGMQEDAEKAEAMRLKYADKKKLASEIHQTI